MSVEYMNITLPDIETSGLTLGEKVCVVAPGPNGRNHYHEIPEDFSILAVNKAVLIDEINPDWWVITHTNTSWFHIADQKYTGIRVYGDCYLNSLTKTAMTRSNKKTYCFSVEKEHLGEKIVHPVAGCVRIGATVSAMAVQMAYNLGAREILLCGVDMSGNYYWDNTEDEDAKPIHEHGEVWGCVKLFNPLLNYFRNEFNVKISTLSKTKLDLPFYY